MATLQQTMGSGGKFEDSIVNTIRQYTNSIYRNIRLETLLTQSGTTEVDILFCYMDVVFIIEAKNVSAIMGDYQDRIWSFVGSTSPTRETREYTSLNVITQNNIHARSFKDVFYSRFNQWPDVVPVIVVPNGCRVSADISGAIHTLSQFDSLLSEVSTWNVVSKIQRRVASMIPGNGVVIQRQDFVFDEKLQKRVKAV